MKFEPQEPMTSFGFRISSFEFFLVKIPRKQFEANVPSMAMGDIAFLLLIFFIILAKAVDDSHVPWTPADRIGKFS